MLSEWGVVLVIVTVVGFIVTCSVPIVYVVKTLTKLNTVIESIVSTMTLDRSQNQQSHDKLWAHNDEQDSMLNDHETRLQLMEKVR